MLRDRVEIFLACSFPISYTKYTCIQEPEYNISYTKYTCTQEPKYRTQIIYGSRATKSIIELARL